MTPRARWRRRGIALAVGVAVLGLHGIALHWAPLPGAAASVPRTTAPPLPEPAVMRVRAVERPAVAPAGESVGEPAPTAQVAVLRAAPLPAAPEAAPPDPGLVRTSTATSSASAGLLSPQAQPQKPDPLPDPAPVPSEEVVAADVAAQPAPGSEHAGGEPVVLAQASRPPVAGPPPTAASAPAAPTAAPSLSAPPVYATRLPPSFQWTYRMQRGVLGGTGTLAWTLEEGRYRLVLDGSVAGVTLLEWVSQGGIDRAGVAPERFVVQVRGRAAQAANFQRGAGKITYSARSVEQPLPDGAQDRLSWLVQLTAVVAQAPDRYTRPGAEIAFYVSGVRGDVGLWQFVVLGPREIDTPSGRVATIALRREARKPYDTRGEIWLDPQRHHLPVQVVLSTIDGNGRVSDSLSLTLQSTDR